jgi:hypothetical protein
LRWCATVEPSTAWQDGVERQSDQLAAVVGGDQSGKIMTEAAKVLTLARSDLSAWKRAHPEVKEVH